MCKNCNGHNHGKFTWKGYLIAAVIILAILAMIIDADAHSQEIHLASAMLPSELAKEITPNVPVDRVESKDAFDIRMRSAAEIEADEAKIKVPGVPVEAWEALVEDLQELSNNITQTPDWAMKIYKVKLTNTVMDGHYNIVDIGNSVIVLQKVEDSSYHILSLHQHRIHLYESGK